jgi:hypothetical protein
MRQRKRFQEMFGGEEKKKEEEHHHPHRVHRRTKTRIYATNPESSLGALNGIVISQSSDQSHPEITNSRSSFSTIIFM